MMTENADKKREQIHLLCSVCLGQNKIALKH